MRLASIGARFTAGVGALLAAAVIHAQGVLPVPTLTARVIDQTATLTPQQSAALEAKLAAIEQKTGAQVVVLMVPTTLPEDIASYAQRVGAQWKIGRKDVGDGLLLTVAKNDRAVEIHVAKTLQGAIPDVLASRIIREQITPAFQAGDFAGGLNRAVDQLGERITGEKLPAPSAQAPPAGRRSASRGFDFQDIALFLFVGAWGHLLVDYPRAQLAGVDLASGWVRPWIIVSSALHFYYDGFLWKMRRPEVRVFV